MWLDSDGNATPVPGGRAPFSSYALSPDGREAAGELVERAKTQVWIFDLERGAKRLLVAEGESHAPIWSRDGVFITYLSTAGDDQAFCRTRADGTGRIEVLMHRPGYSEPEDWSPDGRFLLFSEAHEPRRQRRLDLLGWQVDAPHRQSFRRGIGKVFSRWPIHRFRGRRRRRQPRLRAAVSGSWSSDRNFGRGVGLACMD